MITITTSSGKCLVAEDKEEALVMLTSRLDHAQTTIAFLTWILTLLAGSGIGIAVYRGVI